MPPIGSVPDSAHDGATVSGARQVSAPLVTLQARAKLSFAPTYALVAAVSMSEATAWGCDTQMAWLPLTSTTVEPARRDMSRCAPGGIILSSVVSKYQLGLVFQAGSLIVPPSAASPHGTCESAMKAALSALTSPANEAGNFAFAGRR